MAGPTTEEQADGLLLGRSNRAPLRLPAEALLRHVMALGSSGSGKTVFCKTVVEEAVLQGIPVIAIDPQGDLCSLGLASDPRELERRGEDVARARRYARTIETVLLTPGSDRGIPVTVDPVLLLDRDETPSFSDGAALVASLAGYDLKSDDGGGAVAVLDQALRAHFESPRPRVLRELVATLEAARPFDAWSRYLASKKIEALIRRLARLEVGPRRSLFEGGMPLDIELLLRPLRAGTTRVSVVYLNTLSSEDDKQFFVAQLAERLYRWMLQHPSPTPQALFYIDEVAPFIPPVKKPASKDSLSRLFKQARKYGVGCLMATQNPGDVDYKAMAQFGTWALGRLTTRQDLRKIEPTVRALTPRSDAVLDLLPKHGPGSFTLLSPDHFEEPTPLQSRWLYSRHATLDLETIAEVVPLSHRSQLLPSAPAIPAEAPPDTAAPEPVPIDEEPEMRTPEDRTRSLRVPKNPPVSDSSTSRRKAPLDPTMTPSQQPAKPPGATPSLATGAPSDAPAASSNDPAPHDVATRVVVRSELSSAGGLAVDPAEFVDLSSGGPASQEPTRAVRLDELARAEEANLGGGSASAPDTLRPPPAEPTRSVHLASVDGSNDAATEFVVLPEAREVDRTVDLDALVLLLKTRSSMTTKEFAELAGLSESGARSRLGKLLKAGAVKRFKEGRAYRYFVEGRPDLGLTPKVWAFRRTLNMSGALAVARSECRGGLLGKREAVEGADQLDRGVYKVDIGEKVPAPLLDRLRGTEHDERHGSIYVEPGSLSIVTFGPQGIGFADKPEDHATDIADFDGQAELVSLPVEHLTLDEDRWTSRQSRERSAEVVRDRFQVEIAAITPVFVPLFTLRFGLPNGSYRLLTIDGLVGKTVVWPTKQGS
ncbi:MAG: helicase HerA-like domain-containing protein [Myxococcota bacterium]